MKFLQWYFSLWNWFCSWNLFRADFCSWNLLRSDFRVWNLLRVYFSLCETFTLIFLLVNWFCSWNFLRADFANSSPRETNFVHGTCMLIFALETCWLLIFVHETYLITSVMRSVTSHQCQIKCFVMIFSCKTLLISIFFVMKLAVCGFFLSWNLICHDIFHRKTCCLLIVLSKTWYILIFIRKTCCMWSISSKNLIYFDLRLRETCLIYISSSGNFLHVDFSLREIFMPFFTCYSVMLTYAINLFWPRFICLPQATGHVCGTQMNLV